jgi:hypothetical protein
VVEYLIIDSRIEEVFDEKMDKGNPKEQEKELVKEDASRTNVAGYIILDHYETYLQSLCPGQQHFELTVAKESHVLHSILMHVNNQIDIECVVDPGSQIIAMSEAVCHHLALTYDPSRILNMQSANGEVYQSLGLVRNVPCRIGNIMLFLQMHVIREPTYDILLERPFDVLVESIVKNFPNEHNQGSEHRDNNDYTDFSKRIS